jgi:hypothetical protein
VLLTARRAESEVRETSSSFKFGEEEGGGDADEEDDDGLY